MTVKRSVESLEEDYVVDLSFNDPETNHSNNNTDNQSNNPKNKKSKKVKQQQKPQQPTTPDSLFAQMILFQKNKKNKSELELEQIPKWNPDTFIDSSTLDKNLESIWNALKFAVPSLPSSVSRLHPKSSPTIIYICSSATRCISVINSLKPHTGSKIAKLFSKHMKISEQVDYLRENRVLLSVGTPNRVLKIMDQMKEGEMLKDTQLIVFDSSFVDSKGRGIHTSDECREDAWDLVSRIDGDESLKTKIMFF